ncbi:MAG: hypothetical protein CENE_00166 [Candidatus Celerinatantimonas neptuna]|nr:MAG: hypothetical protein CENE_00166 [Candidatus Celerinatantimonas neptuna]
MSHEINLDVVIEALNPQIIMLTGSSARKDHHKESDVDLLVAVTDSDYFRYKKKHNDLAVFELDGMDIWMMSLTRLYKYIQSENIVNKWTLSSAKLLYSVAGLEIKEPLVGMEIDKRDIRTHILLFEMTFLFKKAERLSMKGLSLDFKAVYAKYLTLFFKMIFIAHSKYPPLPHAMSCELSQLLSEDELSQIDLAIDYTYKGMKHLQFIIYSKLLEKGLGSVVSMKNNASYVFSDELHDDHERFGSFS